ncbi:MAG: DUF120 domain-containing protein [Candidatus Micrarchaeota archaeon]
MKPSKLHLLAELCKRGGRAAPVRVTTTELARSLGASQQTVSRWLDELEREALVERRGKNIKLSRQARAEIEGLAAALEAAPKSAKAAKNAKSAKAGLVLRGVVVKGLGEGAKFLSLPGYSRQLTAALGWKPFPGTLNLRLDAESALVKRRLQALRGISVKSFVEGNKRFGSVKLFACVVRAGKQEQRGAVILPEKSFYGESVLEVIAPLNLRKKLKLKNYASIKISVCAAQAVG